MKQQAERKYYLSLFILLILSFCNYLVLITTTKQFGLVYLLPNPPGTRLYSALPESNTSVLGCAYITYQILFHFQILEENI